MTEERSGQALAVTAYVGLGGNQGDTEYIFARARESLDAMPGVRLGRVSSVYRTEPQGLREQPFFRNQVVELLCSPALQPEMLLDMMLALEASFGRIRHVGHKDGPRPLDLDLLLFGQEVRDSLHLILPHPRTRQRAFVLVPLAELAPELIFPDGMSIQQALERISFTVKGNEIFQNEAV